MAGRPAVGHADQTRDANPRRNWWLAPKGQVHQYALDYVMEVDRLQAPLYDRFVKLEALYDTNPRTNLWNQNPADVFLSKVQENVVASNVDAVSASIAATDVRARFMTTDADWSHQRTAK